MNRESTLKIEFCRCFDLMYNHPNIGKKFGLYKDDEYRFSQYVYALVFVITKGHSFLLPEETFNPEFIRMASPNHISNNID